MINTLRTVISIKQTVASTTDSPLYSNNGDANRKKI